MIRSVILFCGVLSMALTGLSQTLPVGFPAEESAWRREQLLGLRDSSLSFMVRPVNPREVSLDRNDSVPKNSISLLPAVVQFQHNSDLPYGWNDGAIVPSAGVQTYVSAGLFAEYGPLSIQLRPEFVYAENKDYLGLPTDHADIVWARYYDNYFNVTDLPERFGDKDYSRLLPGQSSIRLNVKEFSLGLSTENLYWGPGNRGSLLMSNTAPGFAHITLNTVRPLQTSIGAFEGQLIAGRLDNSGFDPPEVNRIYQGRTLFVPKRDDWRYLSGFVLTYNPLWVPGLFIGAARTSQVYNQDAGKKAGDIFPLLQPFDDKDDLSGREYISSMFFRWLWKEANAEIYAEYGHNKPRKLKYFLTEPDVNAAYLVGLKKIIPFNRSRKEFVEASIELIELQQTSVPANGGWYTSNSVRQGYTHRGQLLGAGIGPGSNLQSLSLNWFRGLKTIGLQVERHLRNNDLYYQIFQDSRDFRKHWVDMSYGLHGSWDYKNVVFNAQATMIRTMNYHYVLYNRPPEYFVPGWDVMNYQVRLGLTYRFD